jgi:4-hydroxybutyrate dehydrogenase/sulfolactaldehyde 3-reductase
MKMINNYMSIALNALTAETLTLAEKAGVDLDVALEVMKGTAASKGHMHTTYPGKVLAGNRTPGFMVDLAMRDLGLAIEMAAAIGSPVDIGKTASGYYKAAQDAGHGRDDWTALYEEVRVNAGLPPRL